MIYPSVALGLNSDRFLTGLSYTDITVYLMKTKLKIFSILSFRFCGLVRQRASMINKITKLILSFSSLSNKVKILILLNELNTDNNIADYINVLIMFAIQS